MSKLQDLARKRNSAKGRIKGLRNNLRGLLRDNSHEYMTQKELHNLSTVENILSDIFSTWDEGWEKIKEEL